MELTFDCIDRQGMEKMVSLQIKDTQRIDKMVGNLLTFKEMKDDIDDERHRTQYIRNTRFTKPNLWRIYRIAFHNQYGNENKRKLFLTRKWDLWNGLNFTCVCLLI